VSGEVVVKKKTWLFVALAVVAIAAVVIGAVPPVREGLFGGPEIYGTWEATDGSGSILRFYETGTLVVLEPRSGQELNGRFELLARDRLKLQIEGGGAGLSALSGWLLSLLGPRVVQVSIGRDQLVLQDPFEEGKLNVYKRLE
jgi:hypothetical protein